MPVLLYTYSSGGDTVLEQSLLYDSTNVLNAPCAECWTSAPARKCLHATAHRSNSNHAPTTEFCSTRSEVTSYCAYSGRRQGSHGRHTQACLASRNSFALRVITSPNQPSQRRTRAPRFTSDTSRAGGGDI